LRECIKERLEEDIQIIRNAREESKKEPVTSTDSKR